MPDTLSPEELDEIRGRDARAADDPHTWTVADRRALLAHIDTLTEERDAVVKRLARIEGPAAHVVFLGLQPGYDDDEFEAEITALEQALSDSPHRAPCPYADTVGELPPFGQDGCSC